MIDNDTFNIFLYVNTAKYLKSTQVFFRIKALLFGLFDNPRFQIDDTFCHSVKDITLFIKELDEDEQFLDRFDIDELLEDRITLLHKTEPFDGKNWYYGKESVLWNYNLQYFEWAIALAIKYQKSGDIKYYTLFKRLFLSWIEDDKQPFAWKPFAISLRIRNLLICKEIFGGFRDESFEKIFYEVIYQQYNYLSSHIEKALLGNHYFENLVSLAICSNLFGEEKEHERYIKEIVKELKEEVLCDNLHFELSPMYHKLFLEDLFRLYISEKDNTAFKSVLSQYIKGMTDSMASIEKGFNRTPHFNDSADNVAKPCQALKNAYFRYFNTRIDDSICDFSDAGYYKMYDDHIAMLVDAGKPGPTYNPGHAHNDCMSFELTLNNNPVFVNCGTMVYEGEERQILRNTEAHNTSILDDVEQSQCWSRHRVAKRSKCRVVERTPVSITAIVKNYEGRELKRSISIGRNTVSVRESVYNNCTIKSYLHVAPEYKVKILIDSLSVEDESGCVFEIKPLNGMFSIKEVIYSTEFERADRCSEICFLWNACKDVLVGYDIIGKD